MAIDVIVKLGGGLLAAPADLDLVLGAIQHLSASRRVLVVPGGGPFADTVRAVDRRIRLSDDAAHWMAVLAMDQYAYLAADRVNAGAGRPASDALPGERARQAFPVASSDGAMAAVVVATLDEAKAALHAKRLPVLAPSRWLREADPLPHSWEVTSDSIAAWVAGQARARDLVLVKPRGATGALVDQAFAHTLPSGVVPEIVNADRAAAMFARRA